MADSRYVAAAVVDATSKSTTKSPRWLAVTNTGDAASCQRTSTVLLGGHPRPTALNEAPAATVDGTAVTDALWAFAIGDIAAMNPPTTVRAAVARRIGSRTKPITYPTQPVTEWLISYTLRHPGFCATGRRTPRVPGSPPQPTLQPGRAARLEQERGRATILVSRYPAN